MWSTDVITEAAMEALGERERALRDEQAVAGLDSLEELELHPLIAGGLGAAGFGVLREQAYPHEWTRKVSRHGGADGADLPAPRDRQRCDIVLTERAGMTLADEVVQTRAREGRLRAARGTLFETLSEREEQREEGGAVEASAGRCQPEDAYWLEVKLVRQFDLSGGAPGFNRAYSSELVGCVSRDLKKLSADDRIHSGGVLLVLFTQDTRVSEHDLGVMLHTLMDRGVGVRSAVVRSMAIVDRIGNGVCTLCLVGARRQDFD